MPKKVLIVDDSLFMRRMLKDILSDKYKIVEGKKVLLQISNLKRKGPT